MNRQPRTVVPPQNSNQPVSGFGAVRHLKDVNKWQTRTTSTQT